MYKMRPHGPDKAVILMFAVIYPLSSLQMKLNQSGRTLSK